MRNVWEATFNSIDEAISIHTVDGTIIRANRAFCRLVGLSEGKIVGKKCYEIVHGSLCFPDFCPLKKTEKSRKKESVEFEIWGRHFIVSTYPVEEDGEINCIVHVIKDITELKAAKKAVRNYAYRLEEANAYKQLLIDITTHDIMNILTILLNSQRFLLDTQLSEEQRELVEMSLDSCNRITSLIEKIAKYSKIGELKKIHPKEVDLTEVIKNAYHILKGEFDKKGIKVILPQKTCTIHCDEIIEEVFYNLLYNALKYSPENSTVQVEIQEDENSVTISFYDQGYGVPEKIKDAIFTRFFRGSFIEKGMGLGLAIVKQIVELHRGSVWVENNQPKGSIFRVKLPKNKKALCNFTLFHNQPLNHINYI